VALKEEAEVEEGRCKNATTVAKVGISAAIAPRLNARLVIAADKKVTSPATALMQVEKRLVNFVVDRVSERRPVNGFVPCYLFLSFLLSKPSIPEYL